MSSDAASGGGYGRSSGRMRTGKGRTQRVQQPAAYTRRKARAAAPRRTPGTSHSVGRAVSRTTSKGRQKDNQRRYAAHYKRLWAKAAKDYPELRGKMPHLIVDRVGNSGFTPWGDSKHVHFSQTLVDALHGPGKRNRQWSADSPLHEWQHSAQMAKYGKKAQKAPEWRLESRAENKKYREAGKLHMTPYVERDYHRYALAKNFPKIAKEYDQRRASGYSGADTKADLRQREQRAKRQQKKYQPYRTAGFKRRASSTRSYGSRFAYALNRSNRK